jgi:hypothetical protein
MGVFEFRSWTKFNLSGALLCSKGAAMDSLAQTYAGELTRWGIETSIVVPRVFTKGTNHFVTSGAPEDQDVVKQYLEDGPYKGYDEQVMQG